MSTHVYHQIIIAHELQSTLATKIWFLVLMSFRHVLIEDVLVGEDFIAELACKRFWIFVGFQVRFEIFFRFERSSADFTAGLVLDMIAVMRLDMSFKVILSMKSFLAIRLITCVWTWLGM